MTTCSLQRSLWTVILVGLLFAAFIGGTQVPIQFSIAKRTDQAPVSLVCDNQVTSARFNSSAVPTTVAFHENLPPVTAPVIEMPTINPAPASIPPVQEPNVPSMPPVVSPPTAIPPQMEIPQPTPTIPPTPRLAMTKGNDSTLSPPPVVESPEPTGLGGKQLEDYCFAQRINTNLQMLADLQIQKATTEKELTEYSTALKQRLNRANNELSDNDAASDKQPASEPPMADKSIDQLIGQVKQLRANNATLDGQMLTLKRAIRTQFEELQKKVKDMDIMDVEPLPKSTVPPPM